MPGHQHGARNAECAEVMQAVRARVTRAKTSVGGVQGGELTENGLLEGEEARACGARGARGVGGSDSASRISVGNEGMRDGMPVSMRRYRRAEQGGEQVGPAVQAHVAGQLAVLVESRGAAGTGATGHVAPPAAAAAGLEVKGRGSVCTPASAVPGRRLRWSAGGLKLVTAGGGEGAGDGGTYGGYGIMMIRAHGCSGCADIRRRYGGVACCPGPFFRVLDMTSSGSQKRGKRLCVLENGRADEFLRELGGGSIRGREGVQHPMRENRERQEKKKKKNAHPGAG